MDGCAHWHYIEQEEIRMIAEEVRIDEPSVRKLLGAANPDAADWQTDALINAVGNM